MKFDVNKIRISYNGGKGYVRVQIGVKSNKIFVTDSFYCRYADISINYPDTSTKSKIIKKLFWVGEQNSSISFVDSHPSENPLSNCSLVNAYDSDSLGGSKLKEFISIQQLALDSFYESNYDSIAKSSALQKTLVNNRNAVLDKTLEYIINNATTYYSLWLFRQTILTSKHFDIEMLLATYQTIFPDTLREIQDSKEINKIFKERIYSQTGNQALGLRMKDVNGISFDLQSYKGKFILFDFWASWYKPCIQQIPVIASLLATNLSRKVNEVFVSLDSDELLFKKAVDTYSIKGRHVFGDREVVKHFLVTAIPQVIVIDPKGDIIYNMEEENDYDLHKFKMLIRSIE